MNEMKAMTSKEREAGKQLPVPEPYQHPKAIKGHVYMVTRHWSPTIVSGYEGAKYYAVMGNGIGEVRLYSLNTGVRWCNKSTFGASDNEWEDITDQVYLNTDELES
ncbi:MAG: hypothetical protein GY743_04310 [Planctomycetaceae bacterium]|nr:hypothetical protein [Planctomycetaceae bacterium]